MLNKRLKVSEFCVSYSCINTFSVCCKLLETNSDLHDASCPSVSRKNTFHNHQENPSHQISRWVVVLLAGSKISPSLLEFNSVSVWSIQSGWSCKLVQMNSNIQQSHFFKTPSLHNTNLPGVLMGTPIHHCTDWYFLLFLWTERTGKGRH